MPIKAKQEEGSLWDRKVFSLMYECQHPGCDALLPFAKMLPLGKSGKERTGSVSIISDNCM